MSRDSTLADIIDDPEAYAAVWATIAKHDEAQSRVFRRHTKWTPGRKLGEVMFQISPPVQEEVAAALDSLSEARR